MIVMNAPTRKTSAIQGCPPPTAPVMTMYLLKNPPNGGMPMTENAQSRNDTAVIGIVLDQAAHLA